MTPREPESKDPLGTCRYCGEAVFGDGDVATGDAATGKFCCVVCFLGPLMRELVEQTGMFNMEEYDKLRESTRAVFDEYRGREIRRRANRRATARGDE
jgi:hypothetical protein